jgi:cytochrome b
MNTSLQSTRIWDLPTRLFHVLLILCVAGLYLSAELLEDNLQIHFYFGFALLTLLIFRVLWGFVGGHWSRFTSFVPSPKRLLQFLRHPSEQVAGHNPLGALSVLVMLLFLLAQVFSGFFSYDDVAFSGPWHNLVSDECGEWLTEYHAEIGKTILLLLIGLHIGSIAFYKRVKNQDLVSPMVHGDKQLPLGTPASTDTTRTRLLALALLAVSAGITYGLIALGA